MDDPLLSNAAVATRSRRRRAAKTTYVFSGGHSRPGSGHKHANHNEAQNAALRRRCSAYRRRQNLYAKTRAGLQRVLDVQRIIHNWVRPHWGLGKRTTPAMAIGLCPRPLSIQEILGMKGVQCIFS
jgi:IS5 family transposase